MLTVWHLINGVAVFAFFAVEFVPDHRLAPCETSCPRPHLPRRIMAHVLEMTTRELRNPIQFFVFVESGDRVKHGNSRSCYPVIAIVSRNDESSSASTECRSPLDKQSNWPGCVGETGIAVFQREYKRKLFSGGIQTAAAPASTISPRGPKNSKFILASSTPSSFRPA